MKKVIIRLAAVLFAAVICISFAACAINKGDGDSNKGESNTTFPTSSSGEETAGFTAEEVTAPIDRSGQNMRLGAYLWYGFVSCAGLTNRHIEEFYEYREPLWGYGYCDIEEMEYQIQLAYDFGLDFFAIDYYASINEGYGSVPADYFVEAKNIIKDRPMVAKEFEGLINELLKSNSPKKWFRAYFNHGLINYIYGQKRLLPCDMAFDTFFIDPYGDVMPCNGTKEKEVMGNLNESDWDTLWNSKQADKVREKVRHCDRQCWMIGSVSPAMHKYIWVPAAWVIKHKFLRFFKENKYSMYENKICRDYRDGKVSKEELDKLSTCDMNAVINDGLSDKSREQLKNKTGEEIVDADIAKQLS